MTAAVYVATHPTLGAHRVGMTDGQAGADRLRVNERHGWRVVGVVHLATRTEAAHVEAATLAGLREDCVPVGVRAADMPHGGHTETVPATAMSALDLLRRVRRTAGQPEDGQGDGRLGAVLELLAWSRRHVSTGAVDTAWEADREGTEALLLRVAEEAESLAAAARAEAEVPAGARALRTLEREAQRMEVIDAHLEELERTMPPEFFDRQDVRAMMREIAQLAENLVTLLDQSPPRAVVAAP